LFICFINRLLRRVAHDFKYLPCLRFSIINSRICYWTSGLCFLPSFFSIL
jgi:hypothetical protein